MKSVTSISGGQTSAFMAANFPSDYNVFSLVRVSDAKCKYPDSKLRAVVEDKIQLPFVGTVEDDTIIHTILDLEQFLGRPIQWVSGPTFEEVIQHKGAYLPNKLHRFCTTQLKLLPIFEWWYSMHIPPVAMQLGFRHSEQSRAKKTLSKCNTQGFAEMKYTRSFHVSGRHARAPFWELIPWQVPVFPLIVNGVNRSQITAYWHGRPVRFAELNNCVGCFHRSPLLLRKMYDTHPEKIQWFADREMENRKINVNARWRSDSIYSDIIRHNLQQELDFSDFTDCDSGMCGPIL